MLKLFDSSSSLPVAERGKAPVAITSFFAGKPLVLDEKVKAGKIDDYVTPTFYAPNVSWLVQRNGMNPRHSLMVLEKPRDFDPFGQTGFAHLWLQYD